MTQPGRILLSDTGGGLAKPSGALPGQAKGGESSDFHPAAFLDADFNQLLAEIGRSVAVAEQPQDLIASCAQRLIAWLSLIETPKDGEVEASTDFLPETAPVLFGRIIGPDPVSTPIQGSNSKGSDIAVGP